MNNQENTEYEDAVKYYNLCKQLFVLNPSQEVFIITKKAERKVIEAKSTRKIRDVNRAFNSDDKDQS